MLYNHFLPAVELEIVSKIKNTVKFKTKSVKHKAGKIGNIGADL